MTMPKNYFIEVLKREINCEGVDKLLCYFEISDFFISSERGN